MTVETHQAWPLIWSDISCSTSAYHCGIYKIMFIWLVFFFYLFFFLLCWSEKLSNPWLWSVKRSEPWVFWSVAPLLNAIISTFPSSSLSPRTWAMKTPRQMWMLGTRPRKPRRFLGAISPRYIGTTLREIPVGQNCGISMGLSECLIFEESIFVLN